MQVPQQVLQHQVSRRPFPLRPQPLQGPVATLVPPHTRTLPLVVHRYEVTRDGNAGYHEGETADICNRLKVAYEGGKNLNLLRCPCYERVNEKDAMKYLQCKMNAGDPEPIIATWSRCQDNKVGHFPSLPGAGQSEYFSHQSPTHIDSGSTEDAPAQEGNMMASAAMGAFGGVASVLGIGLLLCGAQRLYKSRNVQRYPVVQGHAVAMSSPSEATSK